MYNFRHIAGKEQVQVLPFFLFIIILQIIFIHKPFFWDKDIMDSMQANWFLNNSFKLALPDEINPGHPPFVGLLMAVAWYIFGKSLAVAHLVMLPFSIGIILQSFLLVKKLAGKNHFLILAVLIADTTLLTQMVIVSSDLILLFFFLLSVNSVLSKNKLLLALGIAGLAVINNRGLMICGGIFIFDFIYHYRSEKLKFKVRHCLLYFPGFVLAVTFLVYHYSVKGWIGYHENSPWAGCYEKVSWMGMMRNIIVLAWRFIDFGRIIYLFFLGLILIRVIGKKYTLQHNSKSLLLLLIILMATILPVMIVSKNLLSHRYLIPCIYLLSLFVLINLSELLAKKGVYYLILACLLLGNLIVYPDKVAQGWDATLAHVPYHKMHKSMVKYLDEKGIGFKTVGSVTPNRVKFKHMYLNNDNRSFANLDLDKNEYVFYSNIFNDFTDEEIDILRNQWNEEIRFDKMNIKAILYKK